MKLKEIFKKIKNALSEFLCQDIKDTDINENSIPEEWKLCLADVGRLEKEQQNALNTGKTGKRGTFESELIQEAQGSNNRVKLKINRSVKGINEIKIEQPDRLDDDEHIK